MWMCLMDMAVCGPEEYMSMTVPAPGEEEFWSEEGRVGKEDFK